MDGEAGYRGAVPRWLGALPHLEAEGKYPRVAAGSLLPAVRRWAGSSRKETSGHLFGDLSSAH